MDPISGLYIHLHVDNEALVAVFVRTDGLGDVDYRITVHSDPGDPILLGDRADPPGEVGT